MSTTTAWRVGAIGGLALLIAAGIWQGKRVTAREARGPTPAPKQTATDPPGPPKTSAQRPSHPSPPVWITDFEQAKREAAAKDRVILANFQGSDWCHWCKKLNEEVLSRKEFLDYARKSLVLLDVDKPLHKPQPEAVKKQNARLFEEFSVPGTPTVILLNAQGKEIARTGYRPGGAAAYVDHLKGLIKNVWKGR